MTGLVRVTGWPVWMVRAGIEVSAVILGWAMGGIVGAGTAVFALSAGPLTQQSLKLLFVNIGSRHLPDPDPARI
jgi:uncharacterized membrane protein YczE